MPDAAAIRAVPRFIPIPPAGIIGREAELLQARALLRRHDVRLLTLVGTGGVGKTRLALEILRLVEAEYVDGAVYVPIAGVSDPQLVLPSLANALGFGSAENAASLAAEIGDRDLLIVVDNFEQVVSAALVIGDLLRNAPGIQFVVTSRTPLRISGEYQLQVLPLAAPIPTRLGSLVELAAIPAVQLFVTRAEAATGDFTLSEANAMDVAITCARLDGLPLAIELAAARLRLLPLAALVARLDRRLDLLVDGPRDAHPRLRTLRDAVAWSYSLLTPIEQQFLGRLSTFSGSFSLDAIQEVANFDEIMGNDALGGLAALVDNSLIVRLDDFPESPRFRLLESIREFAAEQLLKSEESVETEDRHGTYFLRLADSANAAMHTSNQETWTQRLRAEQENLRHAIQRMIDKGHREQALRLSSALWAYWASHEYYTEGRRWLEQAVAMPGEAPSDLLVRAVYILGNLALTLFDLDAADQHYRHARELWRANGTADNVAFGDLGLGAVARYRGQYKESENFYLQVREAWAESEDPSDLAVIEHALGAMYAEAGDAEHSRQQHQDALRLRREVGELSGLAYTLVSAAVAERWTGDKAAAVIYASEARVQFQVLGDPSSETLAILVLARLSSDEGRDSEALELLREAFLRLQIDLSAKAVIESLETLAGILVKRQALPSAGMLLAAASAHRTARSLVVPVPERTSVANLKKTIGDELGVAAFSSAWSAGLRLSLEQAISEALFAIETPNLPMAASSRYELTRREVDVLGLLAEHLSDREIADRLFLSPRTIERHVSNILLKMEAPNRRLAAAQAVKERLVATAP